MFLFVSVRPTTSVCPVCFCVFLSVSFPACVCVCCVSLCLVLYVSALLMCLLAFLSVYGCFRLLPFVCVCFCVLLLVANRCLRLALSHPSAPMCFCHLLCVAVRFCLRFSRLCSVLFISAPLASQASGAFASQAGGTICIASGPCLLHRQRAALFASQAGSAVAS